MMASPAQATTRLRSPRRIAGHLRDTLRHSTWCAQTYGCITVRPASEPARDHRAVVTYTHVVRMRPGAQAVAVLPAPDQCDAPALQRRADSRIGDQLVQSLPGYRRTGLSSPPFTI